MIFERVKKIADSRNLSLFELEKEIGLKKNYLYKLQNQLPKSDKLVLIADKLDVSIDYLLGRDEFIQRNNTTISGDNKGIAGISEISGGNITINQESYNHDIKDKNQENKATYFEENTNTKLSQDQVLIELKKITLLLKELLDTVKLNQS